MKIGTEVIMVKAVFENKELKIIAFETTNMQTYEPMFHPHGEILYVAEGKLSVAIDGKRRELTSGEMSVVFPYAIHSYEVIDYAKIICILFSTESIGEFSEILLSKIPHNPFLEDADLQVTLIQKVLSYSRGDNPLMHKVCGAYLKALIGEILLKLELKDTTAADCQLVRRVMNYCAEHFCEDIDVDKVCKAAFVSKRYVSKIFAEKLGCSFRDYINTLRISKAKQLLKDTSIAITDVMFECGFKNQSTFNRVFLEETGYSPREFKKTK